MDKKKDFGNFCQNFYSWLNFILKNISIFNSQDQILILVYMLAYDDDVTNGAPF